MLCKPHVMLEEGYYIGRLYVLIAAMHRMGVEV